MAKLKDKMFNRVIDGELEITGEQNINGDLNVSGDLFVNQHLLQPLYKHVTNLGTFISADPTSLAGLTADEFVAKSLEFIKIVETSWQYPICWYKDTNTGNLWLYCFNKSVASPTIYYITYGTQLPTTDTVTPL